jgi:hypothetical protein
MINIASIINMLSIEYRQKFNPSWILTIQNVALFSISIASLYCCANYSFQGHKLLDDQLNITPAASLFGNLLPVIGVHAMIDMFLTTNMELKIHHACTLGILFYNYYYQVDERDRFYILYSLLKTEISSICYVLKYWIPKNTTIYIINDIVFYITFFKFRVIDVYTEIIQSNYIVDVIFNKYSNNNILLSGILFVSYYGLYVLNLYWFFIRTFSSDFSFRRFFPDDDSGHFLL